MENKKLSIITICYNDKTLEKTAKSIINQTWQDFEWVVVDGGSNEEIQQLWNKYKTRIDIFVSEKDNGIYNAYNKGTKIAHGEYLMFLNSGDCFHNKRVLEDVFSGKQYGSDILYGNGKFIKNKFFNTGKIVKPSDIISDTYFINDNICTPAVFIKRDLFKRFGGFNEEYRIVSDLEKWIDFQQKGATFQKIETVISDFDTTGISSSKKYRSIHRQELDRIYETHYAKDVYENAIKNYKRKLTPLQMLFSMVNSKDGRRKEIRIFNKLFVVQNK